MGKCSMGWLLAVGALPFVAGCGPADDGEIVGAEGVEENVDTSELAISANIGMCRNGMSTSLKQLRAASDYMNPVGTFACTLEQVPDFMSYVCSTDPEVCAFLNDVVDGHARLQCTRYKDAAGKKYNCVDVVDRDPLGDMLQGKKGSGVEMNFVIGIYDDDLTNTDNQRVYWNEQAPLYPDPPIALTFAGYYYEPATTSGMVYSRSKPTYGTRRWRVIKFDPRECSSCGGYAGPNVISVVYPDDLEAGWYPQFTSGNCRFETSKPGSPVGQTWEFLDQTKCNQEAQYRATGRW